MYAAGEGVEQDDARAAEWFKRGADAGHVNAMYNYSHHVSHEKGVEFDAGVAMKWLRMAAEHGLEPAQNDLARIQGKDLADLLFGGTNSEDYAKQEWQRKADEAEARRRTESFNADMQRNRNP
jgi:TPR repeat protein